MRLLGRATGDNHAGGAKQTILQPVAAPGLANNGSFRNFVARLVRDRFVQIRIEFCPSASIGCRPLSVRKSSSCFRTMLMPEKIGDFSPSPRAAARPSSKLSTIGNEPLEQRAVGVFDRVLFLARSALLVIFEIGLAAQCQIAKTVEIGLQTGHRIVAVDLLGRRHWLGLRAGDCLSVCVVFGYWNFSHVLRMAIKVMSSFCGCDPTKLRTSSINRVIMAGAPFAALARTRLDHAFEAEFVSLRVERFGDSVGVKNQAIAAFERDGESRPLSYRTRSPLSIPTTIPGGFTGVTVRVAALVKQRRIMPGAREGDAVVGVIENHVGHADEHVFLDVGIELPVYLLQNIGRRRIVRRLAAQDTAADGHDDRGGNAFARNIGNGDAEPFVIHFDIIEIIAADLACRNVDPADFEAVDDGRFAGKEDALNVARDFEIVIEPFLFVRFRINDGVVKREGGLLGDRFENDEIALA